MSSVDIEPITLERILEKGNLQRAFKSVVSNKGAAGVDLMKADELEQYFREHPFEISRKVLEDKYRPQPIKRVYIPKDNGEMRPLGITHRTGQICTAGSSPSTIGRVREAFLR